MIGANAAFNNRTKEELEMHMFKKCGFSPKPSHSVALVILYCLWVWQKTKKSRKEARVGAHSSEILQSFIRCIYSFLCSYYFKSCECVGRD